MTIHDGHRKRLRERYRREGLDTFAPHEVLELLLMYGRARGDVNPVAHRLLDTFGSLKGVLEADAEQLLQVEGVGEETATLLSLALPLFRRYSACLCEERKRIASTQEAEAYCRALLNGRRVECCYAILLSSANDVITVRRIAEGTLTEVAAYPRTVVEAALSSSASAVILCHNHPGGSSTPSAADISLTQRLAAVLEALDIRLHDHIIIAAGDSCSLRQLGVLGKGGT